MTTVREELERISQELHDAYENMPWLARKIMDVWCRYCKSTWPLRLEAIRLALRLDGDDDRQRERLNFMTDHRFLQYSCQQAEAHGKLEALSMMEMIAKDERSPAEIRNYAAAWAEGIENAQKLVQDSYHARDNKYFYWGDY